MEWDDEAHDEFKRILKDAFSEWWVKPATQGWHATLNDIWNQNGLPKDEGRVVFIYENVRNQIFPKTCINYKHFMSLGGA